MPRARIVADTGSLRSPMRTSSPSAKHGAQCAALSAEWGPTSTPPQPGGNEAGETNHGAVAAVGWAVTAAARGPQGGSNAGEKDRLAASRATAAGLAAG